LEQKLGAGAGTGPTQDPGKHLTFEFSFLLLFVLPEYGATLQLHEEGDDNNAVTFFFFVLQKKKKRRRQRCCRHLLLFLFLCVAYFFAALQRSNAVKKAMAATPSPSSCFAALRCNVATEQQRR